VRPIGKPEKEDDDSDHSPKKKPKKSNGAEAKPKRGATSKKTLEVSQDDEDQEMDDDAPIGDMKKYLKIATWEHLVQEIDTVERTPKGQLEVYFRLMNGDRVKEHASLCALRFPQKLISFYESNLRWKLTDS